MKMDDFHIFSSVVEHQNVTRVSEALNLTQKEVSCAVAALESRHGGALFDRVGRNIVLNQAGQAFLAQARETMAKVANAAAVLDEIAGLYRGSLTIAASQTIASYWLPLRLATFRRLYPKIELHIAIGDTAQVAKAVTDGGAELGFVMCEIDNPALSRSVVGHDPLALVVSPDHPWTKYPPVRAEQLHQSPWVLREPGSGSRSRFEAVLEGVGLGVADLEVALVLPGNEGVRVAVEAGVGATVMSRRAAAPGLASGALVEIPFEFPALPFFLLRHVKRYRSPAGETFVDIAKAWG
jgi:DNA-binding transcriptional LysR family regulator